MENGAKRQSVCRKRKKETLSQTQIFESLIYEYGWRKPFTVHLNLETFKLQNLPFQISKFYGIGLFENQSCGKDSIPRREWK